MMPDLTGQQFGSYRLVRLLGSGGFASVYLGQHVRIASQQAAIKVLHLYGVDALAFQQEAETTASLDHPNIVRLLDFDLHQGTMPFLVMYYAPNGSLRTRHPKGTQLPLATVLQYTREVGSALQYAHDSNIIHRDVKPENILIGRRNELLLGDFGIAVLSRTGRTSLEKSYTIGGTAEYMAPEMFRGKPERASDQYSLGTVVYEWLSGTPPFTEGNPIQLGFQHTHEEIPPLRQKLPSLSPAVEAAIMRALAKDAKNRFPSVQAFVDALIEANQARPVVQPILAKPIQERPITAPLKVLPHVKPAPLGTRLLTYKGHTEAVYRATWSPDGTRIASISGDKTVQVWNASTGQLLLTYTGHKGSVSGLAWSPDGTKLASSSADKTVQVWNATNGQLLLTYTGHTYGVHSIAWSLDGSKIVSCSADKTVQIWNTISGYLILTYRGHTDTVFAVAWSPDGTKIASGSDDKTVQVWSAINGERRSTYTGHKSGIGHLAWSPDGTQLVSGSVDKTAQVWEASNCRRLFTYTGHTDSVYGVSWSPDGTKIASGSDDKTVQVWNAKSGQLLYNYTGHTDTVVGVAWSPDGTRIASASWDKTVQIWQAE